MSAAQRLPEILAEEFERIHDKSFDLTFDAKVFTLTHPDVMVKRIRQVEQEAARGSTRFSGADLRYKKLIEWIAKSENKSVTEANIATVLAAKVADEDLAQTETWMQDVSMRPFTKGLLKQLTGWRARFAKDDGNTKDRILLLNRLLIEDTFVEDVKRIDDTQLTNLFNEIRDLPQSALCLSGGGIRSATFGLGILQGLARENALEHFKYLSTVSGGGYVGGWLSAWSRHAGFESVLEGLRHRPDSPLIPEPAPIRHLRQYSNYLAPKIGLMSADSWTLVVTYVRNLLLIWMVVVPLLASVVALPWFIATLVSMKNPFGSGDATSASMLIGTMVVVALLLATIPLHFVHTYLPTSYDANAGTPAADNRRDQPAFLRRCLLPAVISALIWLLAWKWFDSWSLEQSDLIPGSGGVRSIVILCAGLHLATWIVAMRTRVRRRQQTVRKDWIVVLLSGALGGFALAKAPTLLDEIAHIVFSWTSVDFFAFANSNLVYTWLALPCTLLAVSLTGFAYEGATSRRSQDPKREWSARSNAWILIVVVAWSAGVGLVLFGPYLAFILGQQLFAGVGIGSGISTALLGRSSKTTVDGEKSTETKSARNRLVQMVAQKALPLAAALASVALVVGLSALDMKLMLSTCAIPGICADSMAIFSAESVDSLPPYVTLAIVCALFVAGIGVSFLIDTNRFSLHAMYRARLIRAYLGASRPPGDRRPDPFTGFDDADVIQMGAVGQRASSAVNPDGLAPKKPPFHVVNTALNLVAGNNLAWQERKAASFTVSPLHAGSARLGYRNTCPTKASASSNAGEDLLYAGTRGMSLGTAMTISGAAASPNMGYHSSPTITFLMTLLNVRLGWWLGNPGPAGDGTFNLSSPRSAVRPIIDEMLGATNDTNDYVYLSDGGHFENLGLYEMVLRRNRLIVLSDASCDEECALTDLANAVRKIRIDLGIPIEFTGDFHIRSRKNSESLGPNMPPGRYSAIARIRYSCVDMNALESDPTAADYDGLLIYIKPGLYGNEPRDVFNYAMTHKAFPHESTADQFYTESQFESYRALGSHAIDVVKAELGLASLSQIFSEDWRQRQLRGDSAGTVPGNRLG